MNQKQTRKGKENGEDRLENRRKMIYLQCG